MITRIIVKAKLLNKNNSYIKYMIFSWLYFIAWLSYFIYCFFNWGEYVFFLKIMHSLLLVLFTPVLEDLFLSEEKFNNSIKKLDELE